MFNCELKSLVQKALRKNGSFCLGFTLSELLMSVLVISVVMVAMAPVITKRVNDNLHITGSGGGGSSRQEGILFTLSQDKQASGNSLNHDIKCQNRKCTLKIPNGVRNINAIIVGGGGSGGKAASPRTASQSHTVTNGGYKAIDIENHMRGISVPDGMNSAPGPGGGAAYKKKIVGAPTSQADCDPYNAMFVPAAYNGTDGKNLCVTKYNVGDTNGPDIASGTSKGTTGSSGTSCSADACCWQGQTAGSSTTSGTWGSYSTTYSGKNRTVCTWYAANNSCKAWAPNGTNAGDWRLPTKEELAGWQTVIAAETSYSNAKLQKYFGSNGLQLCDSNSSSYGSVYCGNYSNGCPGDYIRSCSPYYVWSGTTSGSNYDFYYLGRGTFYAMSTNSPRSPFSARCVYEGTTEYTGAGGGGGSGANVAVFDRIPNNIIKKAKGAGVLHIHAASTLSGGTGATANDKKASDGQRDGLYTDTAGYNFMKYANSKYRPFNGLRGEGYFNTIINGTLSSEHTDTSYLFLTSKTPASNSDIYFGLVLLNGFPGYGADCSGSTCKPGNGGRLMEQLLRIAGSGYIWPCFYYSVTECSHSNGCSCDESSFIKVYPGEDGQDGMYYSNTSQMIGGYQTNVFGNYGLGGAGMDARPGYGYHTGASGYVGVVGGDGGTVSYNSTSGAITAGNGQGGSGRIDLYIYSYYPVSGGSGGGGGSMVKIHDYPVEAGRTLEIEVGHGGVKPASMGNGFAGGDSSIKYNGLKAVAGGGQGGRDGISQNTSFTSVSAQTTVGAGGATTITIPSQYYEATQGYAGSSSSFIYDENGNLTSSLGGMGGRSAIGSYGGCGGLFVYSDSLSSSVKSDANTNVACANSDTDGMQSKIVIPTYLINTTEYGQAGAGGGGGGWSFDEYNNVGIPGDGQPGYVYIWWTVEG